MAGCLMPLSAPCSGVTWVLMLLPHKAPRFLRDCLRYLVLCLLSCSHIPQTGSDAAGVRLSMLCSCRVVPLALPALCLHAFCPTAPL